MVVAFAPNFPVFVVFRFLQGVFAKGTWMTCYVIGKSCRAPACLGSRAGWGALRGWSAFLCTEGGPVLPVTVPANSRVQGETLPL